MTLVMTLVTGTCPTRSLCAYFYLPTLLPTLVAGAHCPASRSSFGPRTTSTNCLQRRAHHIQPDDAECIASLNCSFGHAEDDTRFLALGNGYAAFFLDRSETFGAVVAHA